MNAIKRTWILLLLAALILPAMGVMAAGMADNPLKNAKVGDWLQYNMTTSAMGQNMVMKMKQTVVAKDATSVTLRTETTMMGKAMPPQDTKIPLNQAYEPYKTDPSITDAKVTPLGEGNETITVGGKAYPCHWVKVKMVATKPAPTDGTVKVWTCKDVPVSGVVKMETETAIKAGTQTMNTKMTMEITGSGR